MEFNCVKWSPDYKKSSHVSSSYLVSLNTHLGFLTCGCVIFQNFLYMSAHELIKLIQGHYKQDEKLLLRGCCKNIYACWVMLAWVYSYMELCTRSEKFYKFTCILLILCFCIMSVECCSIVLLDMSAYELSQANGTLQDRWETVCMIVVAKTYMHVGWCWV